MNSYLTDDFIKLFKELPERIQKLAKKNYKLWKKDIAYPSLEFKRIKNRDNIYSIRVGLGWRALGIKEDEDIIWFWIGSHSEYNNLIK